MTAKIDYKNDPNAVMKRAFQLQKPKLCCLRCERTCGVEFEDSRTKYVEKELNAPIPLCRPCAKEHHEYWDSMWADYYNGCL